MAGAGDREVARCDGGDISWQVQYFVCVRRVDTESFVAGAGNREVVSCGGVTCGGSLVRNARFADLKCEFLGHSRTKRLFMRDG